MTWTPRLIAALQRGGATDLTLRTVLTRFTPRDYLAATDDELRQAGARRITPVDGAVPDAQLITCNDPDWPTWAQNCNSRPAVLCYHGTVPSQSVGVTVLGGPGSGPNVQRVVAAAWNGARSADQPVWTAGTSTNVNWDGTIHLVVNGTEFVETATRMRHGSVCTPQLPGSTQRTPDIRMATAGMLEELCVAAASVVCVVAGTPKSSTSHTAWSALQNGKTVIVPALPDPVAGFELPYLLGTPEWFDRRRFGVPDQGPMFDHVTPLAHAVCRNSQDLTDTVRIAARFACNS